MRKLVLLLPLALAACSNPPPPAVTQTPAAQPAPVTPAAPPPPAPIAPMTPAAVADTAPASFDGYGNARFGMTEAELRAAYGSPLDGQTGTGCDFLHAGGADFLFDGGKVARVSSKVPGPVAPGGGQVGDTRDAIVALHPGFTEEPHKYVEGGKNLVIANGNTKLIFETDANGIVTKWRLGVPPAIDLVEDCG